MNDATLLYVSDDPETFKEHGQLFQARLPNEPMTVRVLFDHVNGVNVPMRLIAAIVNLDAVPVMCGILGGMAGPDANFMNVGHLATNRYVQARELVQGGAVSLHVVDAGDYFMIADFVLQPGHCVAGIYDVQISTTSNAEVRVMACDPSHDALKVFDELPKSPNDGKKRRGVFDITGASTPTKLSYDGTSLTFEIGDKSYPRAALDTYGGGNHQGEYGVLKHYEISVSADSPAAIYQSARGGAATATYVIGGSPYVSGAMTAGAVYKIADLTAGTNTIDIATMPEINSSYPVRLSFDATTIAYDPQEIIRRN